MLSRSLTPRRQLAATAVALAAMFSANSAYACKWYDVPCKTRKAAEAAAAAAKRAAEAAAAAAAEAARRAEEEAKRAAAAARAAATAALSDSDYKVLVNQARSTYSSSAGAVLKTYQQSVDALAKLAQELLEQLLRAAGKAAVAGNQPALRNLVSNIRGLDADGQGRLNAVTRAIASGKITAQVRDDMIALAVKLGFLRNNNGRLEPGASIPGSLVRSNFGVCVGANGGYIAAGVEETWCLAMNLYQENGQFTLGLVEQLGGSIGPQAGASATVGISWSPGAVQESDGGSIGFGLEADGGVGAAMGMSWNPDPSQWNSIPSFNVAVATGASASAAITGGGTILISTFRF
ncbi:hypothetical protein [Pelomonas cellulosilytica]|uniref:Uncharacterized protein n=1 Tax=Pelomonas cellulosilytica TaxID=2906762 RepID=A0ABS8XWF2_9BURK|nr:hypothetical protein [Pelomonas sp. P8]MCE4555043.1 hypothetical protein [Pelomonas sp. P8]